MSTDSTELTFVRCPSCRSLVPAISSRCRMCGATLDASSSAPSDSSTSEAEPRKSGRVRQRTMSEQSPDFKAAVEEVRAEPVSVPQEAPKLETSADAASDDPLSAYIEEVEMEDDSVHQNGGAQAVDSNQADEEPLFDESSEEKQVEPSVVVQQKEVAPVEEKPTPAPKVVVESGPRRPGQGGGLSFSRPHEGEMRRESPRDERPKVEVKPPQNDRAHNEQRGRDNRDNRSGNQNQRQNDRQHENRGAEGRHGDNRQGENRRGDERQRNEQNRRNDSHQQGGDRRQEQRRDERAHQHQAQSPRVENRPAPNSVTTANVSGVQHAGASKGKLFGWLVSYADSNGRAIELREGKFFISGKSLKESDLVIDDRSVSMPHALVMLSREDGMTVQDLMSERGVFVRRGSSGQYQREEETCRVGHGDWIRFGDVEFLVSLVPSEG